MPGKYSGAMVHRHGVVWCLACESYMGDLLEDRDKLLFEIGEEEKRLKAEGIPHCPVCANDDLMPCPDLNNDSAPCKGVMLYECDQDLTVMTCTVCALSLFEVKNG